MKIKYEKNHNHFMTIALQEAQKALKQNEVPVGAIIVNNKTKSIISRAKNKCLKIQDPTAHAELLAINKASKKIDILHSDLTLYTTLEPCSMCAGAIIHARIKRVVYGTDDMKFGAAGSLLNILNNKDMDFQSEVIAGIMAEESQKLLHDFFGKLR